MVSRKPKAKTEDPSVLGSTTTKSLYANSCSICDSMFSVCDFPGIGSITSMHCGRFCGLIYITIMFSKGNQYQSESIGSLASSSDALIYNSHQKKNIFNLTRTSRSISDVWLQRTRREQVARLTISICGYFLIKSAVPCTTSTPSLLSSSPVSCWETTHSPATCKPQADCEGIPCGLGSRRTGPLWDRHGSLKPSSLQWGRHHRSHPVKGQHSHLLH
jgi:hypothetical protein